ncbi:MCP four helix bundle domain-containing protein [Cupriavidus basilensis]
MRDKIEPMLSSEAEKAAFQTIRAVRKPYNDSRDKITKLKEEGSTDEANRVLEGRSLCLPATPISPKSRSCSISSAPASIRPQQHSSAGFVKPRGTA